MLNVLFVDDEPAILDAFRRLLRSQRGQWQMEFVSSAQAALEKMEHSEFDVVVSDMRMPGMDGAQLFGEVMRRQPGAIRILLSGMIGEDEMSRVAATAHHCLAKPCDIKDLVALIDAAVHSGSAAVAGAAPPAMEIAGQSPRQAGRQPPLQAAEDVCLVVDGAAHDLRNILMVIRGFTDVIRGDCDPTSPLQEAATEILFATDRATVVARQLVALGNRCRASGIAPDDAASEAADRTMPAILSIY